MFSATQGFVKLGVIAHLHNDLSLLCLYCSMKNGFNKFNTTPFKDLIFHDGCQGNAIMLFYFFPFDTYHIPSRTS